MSVPDVVESTGGGRPRRRRVLVAGLAALVLVGAGFVVVQRLTDRPACETRVTIKSADGGDRVVYDFADQHGNDVLRYIYLSDQPLPEEFAWRPPTDGARGSMLRLTAPGLDDPLVDGSTFDIGVGRDGRREFVPLSLEDKRLFDDTSRRADGSLTVESVDGELTCLRFDYENEQADLAGTVAIFVTDDDSNRG